MQYHKIHSQPTTQTSAHTDIIANTMSLTKYDVVMSLLILTRGLCKLSKSKALYM